MKIYTIGFAGKSAQDFFGLLNSSSAKHLLDVRVHNNSQLAGFTKKGNIEYFVERLTSLSYVEEPLLAPSEEIFKEYRGDKDWENYESRYVGLLKERDALSELDTTMFEQGAVLLCTEPTAEKCHRRLAAEFLGTQSFPTAEIVHM